MRIHFAAASFLAAAACGTEPAPQPQPDEVEVVDATRVDPGVLGNESVNHGEGSITPAERGSIYEVEQDSPDQVVARFANLLVQRRFDEAYRMWHPQAADFTPEQFASVFERFETINPAIGRTATSAGASGEEVQLTLTGTTKGGASYTVTGPVTVTRAGGQQERWQIAKVILTGDPRAADALVEPQGAQQAN